MLHATFLKYDSPIRIIMSHRGIDIKSFGQFSIYLYSIFFFQCFREGFLGMQLVGSRFPYKNYPYFIDFSH